MLATVLDLDLWGVDVSATGDRLYVTGTEPSGAPSGLLVVVDTATNAVIATVPVGASPRRGHRALYATFHPTCPRRRAWVLRAETLFDLATAAANAASERTAFEDAPLLADFGWRSPHLLSHGQSFLGLFESRMGAQSLWFMDEPEARLSFRNQLALLGMMNDLVKAGSQFVVATHVPVSAGTSPNGDLRIRGPRVPATHLG